MSLFSKLVLGVAVAGCFSAGQANAEVFVWKHDITQISLTYPDAWRHVNNQKPDDILTILAPTNADGSNDRAACRMRVREDRRFAIHPAGYADEIQRDNFSFDFWEEYGGEFNNTRIVEVRDGAGLGREVASMADFAFESALEPGVLKRGLAFASLYNNRLHIFECSANLDAFMGWVPEFRKIMRTVDLSRIGNGKPHGYFRNFTIDKRLAIHGPYSEPYLFGGVMYDPPAYGPHSPRGERTVFSVLEDGVNSVSAAISREYNYIKEGL